MRRWRRYDRALELAPDDEAPLRAAEASCATPGGRPASPAHRAARRRRDRRPARVRARAPRPRLPCESEAAPEPEAPAGRRPRSSRSPRRRGRAAHRGVAASRRPAGAWPRSTCRHAPPRAARRPAAVTRRSSRPRPRRSSMRATRQAARDPLLLAVGVHREAGRLDAALDACLELLAIAPGDPRVHLADRRTSSSTGAGDRSRPRRSSCCSG